MSWLIYGANGYTGQLVARLAVARGERPVLAGRNGPAVTALAGELGLPHRVFDLADGAAVRAALEGVRAVAHCAGPFSATSAPMVAGCLAAGAHYLDITGEVEVFEAIFGRDAEARAAGVVLLPGAGFDVVPTDCLAAALAAALPSATSLDLAFLVGGGMSRGTTRSSIEGMAAGNLRRVDGRLVTTRFGEPARTVPFPRSGATRVGAIRWGDLATAYRSTGIPTITTYTKLPPGSRSRSRRGFWVGSVGTPLARWQTRAIEAVTSSGHSSGSMCPASGTTRCSASGSAPKMVSAHLAGVSRSSAPTSTAAGSVAMCTRASTRCCSSIQGRKPPIVASRALLIDRKSTRLNSSHEW